MGFPPCVEGSAECAPAYPDVEAEVRVVVFEETESRRRVCGRPRRGGEDAMEEEGWPAVCMDR